VGSEERCASVEVSGARNQSNQSLEKVIQKGHSANEK
jgi:hypothetical protein